MDWRVIADYFPMLDIFGDIHSDKWVIDFEHFFDHFYGQVDV